MELQVKYLADIEPIEILDKGDWIDLRASEDVALNKGDFALIPLGVAIRLPEGCEAHVCPRSSTYKRSGTLSPDYIEILNTHGIIQTNYPYGIIDETYCGNEDEWKFPALAVRDTLIKKNDRICQFRIYKTMKNSFESNGEKLKIVEVDNLEGASRGGFGSTGR